MVKQSVLREHESCLISSLIGYKEYHVTSSISDQLILNWSWNQSDRSGDSYSDKIISLSLTRVNAVPAFSSMFHEWARDRLRAAAKCACSQALATIARVCLSNRDLISLGEHILTRTDDRTVHTFHFKIFWKFSLVYFIWISTYHINRGEAASWLVFRTPDWAVPVRVQDGNKVPLSAQEYKCVPVICYGNLTNCGGNYSILASYIG